MKFNIGDRVQTKLTRTPGTVRRISDGLVAVETDDPNVGVPIPIFEIPHGLFLSADAWEKISPSKIVITSDGKTTLARLYDGDKVTRSAEAKCRPTDTYDFAAGADLAYCRLMQPPINHAAYILNHTFSESALKKPVAEDKPRFKAGDKAKIVANSAHHDFPIGEIVVLRSSDYDKTWHAEYLDGRDWWYVKECDLEPYAEPAKEPVQLYCVKGYPGRLTKGKTYEFDGHTLRYDNGPSFYADDFEQWKFGDPSYSACLYPLVSRPAKAGEWVLPPEDWCNDHDRERTIYKVLECDCDYYLDYHGKSACMKGARKYLVLDGYDGRYEPKEPKKSCANCGKLCIINKAPVYAYCPAKKKVFECFENYTSKDVCDDWYKGEAT